MEKNDDVEKSKVAVLKDDKDEDNNVVHIDIAERHGRSLSISTTEERQITPIRASQIEGIHSIFRD